MILRKLGIENKDYALLTLHRPGNVDDKVALDNQLQIIENIQKQILLVFPVHPRTKKMIANFGFEPRLAKMKNLLLIEPVGYTDFIRLLEKAKVVLTDSGGIQEESTFLQVPCLTLRENTERPITIREGTNSLVGHNLEQIRQELENILNGKYKQGRIPPLWDGKTTGRIIEVLKKKF